MKNYVKGTTINCRSCGTAVLRLTKDLTSNDLITTTNVEWATYTHRPKLNEHTPIDCGCCGTGLTFDLIIAPEGR